jgi:hypothetical protein
MEENYWAEQQRRLGHGYVRLNEQLDENYWTHHGDRGFVQLKEHRDENYWTQDRRKGFRLKGEYRDENHWRQPYEMPVHPRMRRGGRADYDGGERFEQRPWNSHASR